MSRKSVGIFALFAVICVAFSSRENCGEEKLRECKSRVFDLLAGGFTEKEICQEMRVVNQCLRNVADECFGEEEHRDVQRTLEEFEDFLGNNCEGDEVRKCLSDNDDYLFECISAMGTEDISQLMQHESIPTGMDPKFVKCHLYGIMSRCIVGRAVERCGATGGETAAQLLFDLPPSVQESCDSQQDSVDDSVQDLFSVNFLGQRKRRDLMGYRKKRELEYRRKRELEYRRKRELEYRRKRDLEYRRKRDLEYRRKRELEYRKKRTPQDWLPMTFAGKR